MLVAVKFEVCLVWNEASLNYASCYIFVSSCFVSTLNATRHRQINNLNFRMSICTGVHILFCSTWHLKLILFRKKLVFQEDWWNQKISLVWVSNIICKHIILCSHSKSGLIVYLTWTPFATLLYLLQLAVLRASLAEPVKTRTENFTGRKIAGAEQSP
jgi:hypothetical protein